MRRSASYSCCSICQVGAAKRLLVSAAAYRQFVLQYARPLDHLRDLNGLFSWFGKGIGHGGRRTRGIFYSSIARTTLDPGATLIFRSNRIDDSRVCPCSLLCIARSIRRGLFVSSVASRELFSIS